MPGYRESGFISCSREILWSGAGRSRRMKNKMRRYRLIRARYLALPERYRDEALRSVATRRLTLGTSAQSGSANLEKTGLFLVKSQNRCRVFQCTVNWSRARHG